jgi:putative Holliday junction resolvase
VNVERGRRLAFDFGDVRIGVAVSDPDSILATPVTTLTSKSLELWDQIFALLEEYEPVQIFVGRPTHLAGHESESTLKAEMFAQELRERFDLSVLMVDERLSTVSAQRALKSAGVSSRGSKSAIDQMAAVEILNLGLEILAHKEKQRPNA